MDILAALGESIINLIVGMLILILEFLLTIVAFLLDTVIYTFSFMFDSDFMSKVYEAMPVISKADDVLTMMGIAVAIILLCSMIIHMGLTPLISAGKNVPYPSLIVFRTLLVIPLVICAEKISIYLSNIFASFYSMMLTAYSDELETKFFLTSALSGYFEGDLDSALSTPTESMQAIQDGMGLTESVMSTISSAVGILLVLFLIIMVGWNLIQLFLEMFERFATMFFLMKISPLTLATAIYPSSEKVAKSWLSFFIGQFCVWVLQIMCLGWVIGCLGNVSQFDAAFPESKITAMVCWAGICYGLINMSRHIDDYINKLGLTAAVTGGDFFKDITPLVGAARAGKRIANATGGAIKGGAQMAKSGFNGAKAAGSAVLGAGNTATARFSKGGMKNVVSGGIHDAKQAVSNMAQSKGVKAAVAAGVGTTAAVTAFASAPVAAAVGLGVATGAGVQAVKSVAANKIKSNSVAKMKATEAAVAKNIPHDPAPAGTTESSHVKIGKPEMDGTRKYNAQFTHTDKSGIVMSDQAYEGKLAGYDGSKVQSVDKTFSYQFNDDNTFNVSSKGQPDAKYQTKKEGNQYNTYKVGNDGKLGDKPVHSQQAPKGAGNSTEEIAKASHAAAKKMNGM